MNRAGLAMIEADSLGQVQGRCVYPLVCEEHREALQALVRDVFSGRSGTMEFRIVGLKGRPVWLYTHAVPLRDAAGKVASLLAVTVDITDRKAAEERLRESESFVRNILDTVDEGFIVVDRDFRILTANKAYRAQCGWGAGEIVGRNCYEVSAPRPCSERRSARAARVRNREVLCSAAPAHRLPGDSPTSRRGLFDH
jgi:PAS domain-containing protein